MTTTPRPAWYDQQAVDHMRLIQKIARKFPFGTHEDMVQDIYLDLLRKWDKYDGARYRFASWVWTCAANTFTELRIKASTQKRTADTVSFDDTYSAAVPAHQHGCAELSEVLRNLSGTRDSEALMRIAMGDELQDVANDFGVSRERVRQLAERERQRLRSA